MELFRYSRDAWGQQTLEGISWDLFWVVIGIAAVSIVGHMIFKAVSGKKKTAGS